MFRISTKSLVLVILVSLYLCSVVGPSHAAPRVAFITSEAGNGVLSSWPSSDGLVGIDGADRVCQNLATAAGLSDPDDFIAWLSDSNDDAYCRVHGLTGRITDPMPCGQAELPIFAGPWRRTDGTPLVPSAEGLLPNGPFWVPLWLDENGDPRLTTAVYTGNSYLFPPVAHCENWTTTLSAAAFGGSVATTYVWAQSGGAPCGASLPIYCFQVGAGDPVPAPDSEGRIAFLSTSFGTGNLGSWAAAGGFTGIEAADAICRSDAADAGLDNPDRFRAWISDATVDARDRIPGDGPWVRLDGQRIALNNADLLDGQLEAPINVTADGSYGTNPGVWTGTSLDGTAAPQRCADWTSGSSGSSAAQGASSYASDFWTRYVAFDPPCDNFEARLYCFSELSGNLFFDGFESGGTAAWSATSPSP